MKALFLVPSALLAFSTIANAQTTMKHEDTEFYEPVPAVVTPGSVITTPPSDAIVLFNGSNLDHWVKTDDNTKPADWIVGNQVLTVNKNSGNIQTKKSFTDYQLHIEWRIPENITGTGQARGNSGIFLASLGKGDAGYELQVLNSYNNPTYVNGQAGSIYKQSAPLVNANKTPGEWQTYDIIWTAPRFESNGSVKTKARVTVLLNGIVVQNNYELQGPTLYVGHPVYQQHSAAPIKLQAHGDKSEPISFRNIWIRNL